MSIDRKAVLGAVMLIVMVATAYFPVTGSGFIWDDDAYVTENQNLEDLEGLKRIWLSPGSSVQYYPLVFSLFWIEHRFWGEAPLGYHLVNIILHALNSILLWRILKVLSVPGAWLAAAVFALHPVHVESVAWITERKNVLSGFFYMSAMLAYFRFSPPGGDEEPSGSRWTFYAVSFFLFLCALFSKSVTATLPAAILVVLWWKRGRITGRDTTLLLPMFLAGAALGLHTAYIENYRVIGPEGGWDYTFFERCLIAGRALWFYAAKLLWPVPLIFFYPRWLVDAGRLWQYMFPLSALALVPLLWALRSRIGRGPLAAVLFFGGSLFPALGFLNVYPMRYSFVADHFQYLASLGLIVLFVGSGSHLAPRLGLGNTSVRRALGVGLLAALGILTWRQSHMYHNEETLWRETLARDPDSPIARNNLGVMLMRRGDYPGARDHFEHFLRLRPDHADAHYNIGTVYSKLGRLERAKAHFESALRIDPGMAKAHNNLGRVYHGEGDLARARAHFESALRIKVDLVEALFNLGLVHLEEGSLAEAESRFRLALQLRPDFADAYYHLGVIYLERGETRRAESSFERALLIMPGHGRARFSLERLREDSGRGGTP